MPVGPGQRVAGPSTAEQGAGLSSGSRAAPGARPSPRPLGQPGLCRGRRWEAKAAIVPLAPDDPQQIGPFRARLGQAGWVRGSQLADHESAPYRPPWDSPPGCQQAGRSDWPGRHHGALQQSVGYSATADGLQAAHPRSPEWPLTCEPSVRCRVKSVICPPRVRARQAAQVSAPNVVRSSMRVSRSPATYHFAALAMLRRGKQIMSLGPASDPKVVPGWIEDAEVFQAPGPIPEIFFERPPCRRDPITLARSRPARAGALYQRRSPGCG